jgi:23S rRNA (cytosine1962-C5)-methyltransferase
MDDAIPGLLQAAAAKRAALKAHTDAVRLVNGYGDGMDGLVVEQHAACFVAQVFDARWFDAEGMLIDFVKGLGGRSFIVKDRTASSAATPDAIKPRVWIDGATATVVEEYGAKFSVEMNDTLNTGLFLDMRANRQRVAALAAGRRVLNLFAYTCSFGVHCRRQGATAVVNVDVSRKSLERAAVNYGLNGLVAEKNEFIRADTVEYLERAVKKDNRFGMIILDPPSFARYEGRAFSIKKDLPRLVEMAVKVLEPDGVLFVATNFSEMLHSHLQNIIKAAARGRQLKNVQCLGQDVDFPGTGFMAESCLTAVLARM